MPDKKKQTHAEKKRIEAEKIAKAVKIARRYVKPSKPIKKKAKPRSRFSEIIAGLRKKVRKHFDKEKKKEFESARTKQVKEQLHKAGLSEADIKRLQGKKKNNPHKKRGGY